MMKTDQIEIPTPDKSPREFTSGMSVDLGPGIKGTYTGDTSQIPPGVKPSASQSGPSYSEAGLEAYREQFARGQQEQAISKIRQQYASFDNATKDAKISAVKDLSHNPYLFNDPFDGLNNNLWRWSQQAPAFASRSNSEREQIASRWYDEQIAPFYAAMKADPPSKKEWLDQAWGQALKFDPSQAYHTPLIHGLINGFESGMSSLARSGQTAFSLFGIPLRTYTDALKSPSLAPLAGWHNLALNVLNRPSGTSMIGAALKFGSEAPGLGKLASWDKEAADYFSFWHDITPNRTWTEKASSFIADNALQLPLFIGASKAAEMGLNLVSRIGEAGASGFPTIANLTKTLGATKTGQFAAKLLTLGGEGLAYGSVSRDLDDKSGAWKDALNFMAMGSVFSVFGKKASKLIDILPEGSEDHKVMLDAEQVADLGMQGKRKASPEEILGFHRQNIAGVAAAGGHPAVSAVFEEALHHVRMNEQEGWTPETWIAWIHQHMQGDSVRYHSVFSTVAMMRQWLKDNGTSIAKIDEELARGDSKTHDAFMEFLGSQVSQAIDEMGIHVSPVTDSEAERRADQYEKSEQGQQELKGLLQNGVPPDQAKKQVRAKAVKDQKGFVEKAEDARNVQGPANVAKTQEKMKPAQHEPLLKRQGRYVYDKEGKAIGYQMSVGFDWKLAAEKASSDKGWKGTKAASDEFWKNFISLYDGDNLDHDSFAQDLKSYFDPLKNKDLQWEKGSGDDHTNFFGFMYHFRDKLPGPVADKLQEILIESPKIQKILNSRRITEDQLEHFGQAVANHVEMFMRSKWYLENGERHVFRSTKPTIEGNTKWQRDLILDMQKRELRGAGEYFPGRTKAAQQARKAYQDALKIIHQDELAAFDAQYPKDKQAGPRLARSMETAKDIQKRARAGRLSMGTLMKLMEDHDALMKRLGKDWESK